MKKRLTRRHLLGAGLAGAAGLASDALLLEPRWVEVTRHRLEVPNLPAALTGLTIAQLTDVHLTDLHAAARRVAETLAGARPDVVVLTGDIVESAPELDLLAGWAPEVRGRLATLAVLGNWELWAQLDIGRLGRVYERAGVRFVRNEAAVVEIDGHRLGFVGLDDTFIGRPDPVAAHRDLPDVDALVWLAHAPQWVDGLSARPEVAELPRPDLILSGHTHGGQVRHPMGPIFTPEGSGRFVSGWYRDTWAPLYVSRGIGLSIAPVRVLCRPELPVFELTPARATRARGRGA